MKVIKIPRSTLIRHTIIWACLILYITFFNPVVGPSISQPFYITIFISNFIFSYYILLNFIFPSFFDKNKILFFISYLFVIALFVLIDYIHLKKILPHFGAYTPRGNLPLYSFIKSSILLFSYIAFTTTGWYLNSRSIQRVKEKLDNEKNIIARELNFLKNQFNSHLTFNFLSFCYGKMLNYSPKAAESIENFSDMLHYSFGLKLTEYVSLTKEVEYIENFIEVQKCLTNTIFVEFRHEGDIEKYQILPMLLGVFVENSFKHGVINDPLNPIIVFLSVNNNEIFFKIKNNNAINTKTVSTGIGIQNAERILNLFYRNNHSLTIDKTDTSYSCELNLKINSIL
jgi:two-component system LytT family sensor kinase